MRDCQKKIYGNRGSPALLELVAANSRVLDCGCGAGDNARHLKLRGCRTVGFTVSSEEQKAASTHCEQVFLADLEGGIPAHIEGAFDFILLCHVLEHLVHPEIVLRDVHQLLSPQGRLAVALPNVLFYPNRVRFLAGGFEYTQAGIMDETHVRFYTYATGRRLLEENGYRVLLAKGDGAFPLWKLRRLLRRTWVQRINASACRRWPGLFGVQCLYLAASLRPAESQALHQVKLGLL